MPESTFSVYILRCADDSFYTGIATDVERRVAEHRGSPRGAKYLKGRAPFEVVFCSVVGDRSAALQMEHRIKRLSRKEKEALIKGGLTLPGG